jgi:hypothetical protein
MAMPEVTADTKQAVNEVYRNALRRTLNNAGDNCQRYGMTDEDSYMMVMSGLLFEVITGAIHNRMTEDDFMQMMSVAWSNMRSSALRQIEDVEHNE